MCLICLGIPGTPGPIGFPGKFQIISYSFMYSNQMKSVLIQAKGERLELMD